MRNGHAAPLTVCDMIMGIHDSLMKPVDAYDFKNGVLSSSNGKWPSDVWKAACLRSPNERRPTVRRIDWLKGSHYFHGIKEATQNGRWKLLTERRP